jgi:cytoskeletal protein RodZ
MVRHLPVVRIRVSTALIALVFLVTFVVYLLVRPIPESIAKDQPPTPNSSGQPTRSPSPSSRPSRSPAPSPTQSPTATATRSASASVGPHSSSPPPG